ncbi:hypothetical protein I302_105777 [Kwoniella bestiolae CBS 10118]|uniref:TEA domain-containing protein n=1 Tax=Kwoniella bestiolae CBS 10118 TaxID=1296100 RepID=A0A1B9G246_9TREE|nr:hypothetical protein I302_04899 [Kwoniella bestiolae CBS 10118]OCF25089.1 hypothetical protein I302_04899 [Kwoniella bestiolae CBS 10118]
MASWTGSPITVEEAFHQVWKSSVEIQPSFYFPSTNLPSPVSSTEDDLATAEILARIKFGSSSPLRDSRKRSLTSSNGDGEEDDVKPTLKRKKESSVESVGSGGAGGAERWPPRKEFVYLTCVVAIPPVGRQKLPLFGKPCGRNEIIAKVVTMATGEGCSRKLISSHAQVLKGRKELSKQLRDLLTTEEGKNTDDEAAPTVYTLGAEWNFPKCLNRLIGLPDNLDLRTASTPPLIAQHFTEVIKPPKSSKKERVTPANKNKLTIMTRPSKSLSPSVFSATTTSPSMISSNEDQTVHLPTPKSSYLPSPYLLGTPTPYSYDHDQDRRPSLPSPSDLFSPNYKLSTPSRMNVSECIAPPTTIPRRPATANAISSSTTRQLPPPESPISTRFLIDSPYQTPLSSARRTSESHLTASLGRSSYDTFERECLKIMGDANRRISGVSIEDIKRRERNQQRC